MLKAHIKDATGGQYISTEVAKLSKLHTFTAQYIANSSQSIYLKINLQGFESKVLAKVTQMMKQVEGLQL